MKPKYCAIFSRLHEAPARFAGLSESQLVKTLIAQGFHTVSSITIEEEATHTVHPVQGKELISIWRQVYQIIRK